MKKKLKICGITDPSNMKDIAHTKPDMIGLIFASSQRKVSLSSAQKIADIAHDNGIQVVAVFQNAPRSYIKEITRIVPCDFVQLHGDEPVEYCKKIMIPIIKTFTPTSFISPKEYLDCTDMFLFDKNKTSDMPIDYKRVSQYSKLHKTLIAGGISSKNISSTIKHAGSHIYGIDVSSSVETSIGIKDSNKINELKKYIS